MASKAVRTYLKKYPSRRVILRKWFIVTTAMAMAGVSFGYGIPLLDRVLHIRTSQGRHAVATAQNSFWEEVSGQGVITNDPTGKLAFKVQTLLAAPHPVIALRQEEMSDSDYPGVRQLLGLTIYSTNSDGSGDSTQGHFTDAFLLLALETKVDPGSALHTVPAVLTPGDLRWEYLADGEAILLLLLLAGIALSALDKHLWYHRARTAFLRGHTDVVRECFFALERAEGSDAWRSARVEIRRLLDASLDNERQLTQDGDAGLQSTVLTDLRALLTAQEALISERRGE